MGMGEIKQLKPKHKLWIQIWIWIMKSIIYEFKFEFELWKIELNLKDTFRKDKHL
jgi:hypothetical protein